MRRSLSSLRVYNRFIHFLFVLGLVSSLIAIPSPALASDCPAAAASTPAVAADYHPPAASAPSDLLSFTAGGHVLGFQATGVYVAGSNRLLKVEFAGTAGVAPVVEGAPGNGSASPSDPSNPDRSVPGQGRAGLEGASPLGKVTYRDIWPGISLTYEAQAGGIAKSTYLVASGASVEAI
ncbi:MAG: hypothetical protein HYX94_12835 [Chloroflexi bacterium]|nr:hypothetical protein [Chloroflexota bacterium]